MTRPIDKLGEVAKAIQNVATPEEKSAALEVAFELFTKEAEGLANAYGVLQKKFDALNIELQDTNEKLNSKVAALNFATHYLDNLLSQMSQGLLFVDLNGIITTYNKTAEAILGHSAQEAMLKPFWDLFPDELFGFSLKKALEEKKPLPLKSVSLKKQEKVVREIEIDNKFILKEDPQGLIILLRDITELRRLQVIAERNERLKELGEMAAMIAHEIRNPLGGIKGFASLLQRDLKDQPELAKMAGYIVDGTNTLNRLVSTVLHYAHPLEIQIEMNDLEPLLLELIDHVKADISLNQNIEITFQNKNPPVKALVDPALIKGAVLNLIVNAIQSMPNGGPVHIALEKSATHAIIKIADEGIGIPKENMKKIFSPFFTTRADGNGFGLAEVYKVMQAHEGTIDVESTEEKGTTFSLNLPLTGEKDGA